MPARNRKKGVLPTVGSVTQSLNAESGSTKPLDRKSKGSAYVPPKRKNQQGTMIYLPKSLHKQIKLWALQDDTTMQNIFEELAKEYAAKKGVDPAVFYEK